MNLEFLWKKIKENPLLYVLLIAGIVRLIYLWMDFPLWWDSHVYIGMGKYIFSQGELGIWEAFRPLTHPIIIGFLWKIGLSPIVFGKVLDLIFSLLVVYLTFKIGDKIFNKNVAIISSFIVSITGLFVMFSGLIQTEPLAMFFGLLGVYIFLNEKNTVNLFLSGLFLSLSFLTKFPQGIFFGTVFLVLLFRKNELKMKIKELFVLTLGFIIPITPYFIFNYFRYQNIFEPFISGSWIVTTATWLYGSGIFYYFKKFFVSNPIFLTFFVYIYLFIKEPKLRKINKLVVFLIPLFTLIYFLYVPRKEPRYLVTIVPFLAIIASQVIITFYYKLKEIENPFMKAKSFMIICLLFSLIALPEVFFSEKIPNFDSEIKEIIEEYQIKGTVIGSHPSLGSFIDQPVVLLSSMEYSPTIYKEEQGRYELLVINDCDFICSPTDTTCSETREKMLKDMQEKHQKLFEESFLMNKHNKEKTQECTYTIYLPNEMEDKK